MTLDASMRCRLAPFASFAPGRRALTLLVGGLLLVTACGGDGGPPGSGQITLPPQVPTPPAKAAKWALVWGDEFEGATLDAANWKVMDGAANVNNELEFYTPSDVYLENGSLVLKTERRQLGGRSFTSGEVQSGAAHTVTRGNAVEWRTQVPSGQGIWPANWLVATLCTGLTGCGGDWPPEIDVLEMRGHEPNVNVMTHWWGAYPNQQYETSTYTAPSSLADGFHTYRIEWFPDSLLWYIDGTQRVKHGQNVTAGVLKLVMNTAVGGDFVGRPDQTTVFPQYQRIDYVRVYRDTANTY